MAKPKKKAEKTSVAGDASAEAKKQALETAILQIEKEYGKVDVISSSMGDWSYHQWIYRDNKGGFSNKGPKKSDGQRKLKYLQAEYLNNTIK